MTSRECLASGYHIEVPRREPSQPEDFELLDSDKDVKFFEQLSKSCKSFYNFNQKIINNKKIFFLQNVANITHYVGENSSGDIAIVSMEHDKNRKFQRVIVRTAKEDQRFLVSTSSSSKYVKALENQCPILSSVITIIFLFVIKY